MGKDKKLFKSEDFDKKKNLFTPEDFDKHTETNDNSTGVNEDVQVKDTSSTDMSTSNGSNWKKFVGAIVVVAAVVIGCIVLIPKSNTDTSETESIVKVTNNTGTETVKENDSISKNNVEETSDDINKKSTDDSTSIPSNAKCVIPETSAITEDVTEQNDDINVEGSTETLAQEVIAGKYANWPERERKLGKRYKEIQSKVNEMYRKGLVK